MGALGRHRSIGMLVAGALAAHVAAARAMDPPPASPDARAPAAAIDGGPAAYALGPEDKLAVRVFEWQTLTGEVREWAAASGEFVVGAAGTVSVPFVGEVPAAGRSPAELAQTIGDRLQAELGLSDRPAAAVEVIEYRPFYVLGAVRDPGRYPFAPDMTVLQAFGLAGGTPRQAEYGARASRDYINAVGSIDVLEEERAGLLVRRARIRAESEGDDLAAPSIEGVDGDQLDRLVADETAILQARRNSLDGELAALNDLIELLTREIAALEEKLAAIDRQIALVAEDQAGVAQLRERGLAVNTRVLDVERAVADLESSKLDMNTAILRARQEIAKAEQSRASLRTGFEARTAEDRLRTESDLARVEAQIAQQAGLRDEAASYAADIAARDDEGLKPRFTITRTIAGRAVSLAVDRNAPLVPGDVLEVELAPQVALASRDVPSAAAPTLETTSLAMERGASPGGVAPAAE